MIWEACRGVTPAQGRDASFATSISQEPLATP